jgi:hypothetical protein
MVDLVTAGVEALAQADPVFVGACLEAEAGLSGAQREALRVVLKQPPPQRRG